MNVTEKDKVLLDDFVDYVEKSTTISDVPRGLMTGLVESFMLSPYYYPVFEAVVDVQELLSE